MSESDSWNIETFSGLGETAASAQEYVKSAIVGGQQSNLDHDMFLTSSIDNVQSVAISDSVTGAASASADAASSAKEFIRERLAGAKDTVLPESETPGIESSRGNVSCLVSCLRIMLKS